MKDYSYYFALPLAGYSIRSTTAVELSSLLKYRFNESKKTVLLFANSNFLIKCQSLRNWLDSDSVILVNDGIGLDIACRLVHGVGYKENLNGTDFLPYLFKTWNPQHKIFLLGGKFGIAEKAAIAIERNSEQKVVGCLNGYSDFSHAQQCELINQSGADIILVAMGNPLQEEWIYENMNSLDARLFVGVGALLDFLAGAAQRAPMWIQGIRCEWLFRLCHEPVRLLRRYTIDVLYFLYLCLRNSNINK